MSEQQFHVTGDGGNPANLCLLESRLHRHLRQRASLPTDGANCRDTIFNDPRMTLGSYVKGPNNIIYREWDRKAGPWSLDGGLVMIFMEAHTKVGLTRIARLYIGVAWRVGVLGLSPRSFTFSPLFFFCRIFFFSPFSPGSLPLLYQCFLSVFRLRVSFAFLGY